jgi:hypothetical protein
MKKILLISLMILAAFGCYAKKPANKLIPNKFPKNIEYSTGFKAFCKDLGLESQGLESLADYQPSNQMQAVYTFITMPDGKAGIEGFLQVNTVFFDAYSFEQLDGYLTYINEGIYQYKISVENIFKVLDIRGVIQIDIPQNIKR